MATGKPTDPKLKAEILDKIRNHGVAVSTISEATGVSTPVICRWLRTGIVDKDRNLILENNRLRKENEQLYKMLGKATAELGWSQVKTRRIRRLAGITIARRSKRYGKRSKPER